MEMFSFGKELSTLSQVSYFLVKEEAKEDIMGYKEVEPQNKICALKSELSEEAPSALLSSSFAVVLSAAVSFSFVAAVVEAVLLFAPQATREEARRRPLSNKDSCIGSGSRGKSFSGNQRKLSRKSFAYGMQVLEKWKNIRQYGTMEPSLTEEAQHAS